MSEFTCHQTGTAVHVILEPPENDRPPKSVVTISRAVGNERARALMRMCAAVLAGDYLEAQHELDLLDPDLAAQYDFIDPEVP